MQTTGGIKLDVNIKIIFQNNEDTTVPIFPTYLLAS